MNKAMPSLAALLAVTGGAAHAQSESTAQGAAVEEIVVTGSRIARDGITAPTPVTVVSEARLENLGATNIGQVLNTLPAFRATSNPQTSNIQPRNAGMIQADLRGLGPNRTLVLVNGRRFTPSTQEGTVDLNQIPTLLIERTEVVTGGASAAYGSDAVAGVVNLILKDDLEGVRTQIQYGQTEESDNETLNVGVAAGTAFADGRGHVSVALEYEDNKGTGGCYTRDWCAQEYQVVTNTGTGRITTLPANNILSRTHTVNAVVGGLVLSGPLAGTTFNPDGTPRPYQYGQRFPTNPIFMVGGEGSNGFIGAPLMVVPVERSNVFVQSSFDFTDSLTGRVEASYGQMEANGRGAQTRDFLPGGGGAITMRGDNPFIPAQMQASLLAAGQTLTPATSFTFGHMGDDFGYTQNETATDVYRVLVGLDGNIGDWDWDAYYQYGQTDYEQIIRNNRIQQQIAGVPLAAGLTPGGAPISCLNTPAACTRIQLAADVTTHPTTGQPICRITLTDPTLGCVPVNLFGYNRYSQAAYEYLYGTGYLTNDLEQHVVAASIQGDLFETGAGVVPLAAGIEYRSMEVGTTADPISASTGFYVFNSTIVNGKIEVKEAFAETVVPLLRDVTGVRSLELNGAVRLTDYTTSGEVTTWKVGMVYEPSDWFRLRAARSRDIRAPNTDELFRPQTSGFVTIDGVLRTQITGGNTELVPEEADTFTVGVGFTGLGWAEGFRASIDYYRIDIQDAISTLTAQTIVNRCRGFGTYCDQVTFENPADRNSPPSVVRVLFQNLNQLEVNGIDFEINYNLPTSFGTWDFNILATYLDELKTTDATDTAIDRAGVTGNNVSGGGAGLPEWQANALVSYNVGNLTVTAEGRYIDDGLFDSTLIGPEQAGYSVALPNSINTNHVDSRFYMNLGARYAFELSNDMNLELFGGVRNVFDKDPPVAPSNQGSSNLILFDPLGRAYQVGVRVDF